MAGFIRRFVSFPDLATIQQIEGVDIIDLIPPGVFVGRTTGTVCLVGEWPKGPYNTPTIVEGPGTLQNVFGGFSLSLRDPLSPTLNPYSNGNAFCWLTRKAFQRLVVVRPNLEVGTVTITLGGTPNPTDRVITIPAGTRIRAPLAPTQEFALSQDLVFAVGVVVGSGPQAFTGGPGGTSQTQAQVTGVPVYSTQGNSATNAGVLTQVDATDLQRAGIGAGTPLPSITVSVTNPAALTALTSAQIDAAYQAGFDSTLPGTGSAGTGATDAIGIICSARQSTAIRAALLLNAATSAGRGMGRTAVTRPPIGTLPAAARGAVDPGVGTNRGDRLDFAYPHVTQLIQEIATLDPQAVISLPTILVGFDAGVASVLSMLPAERNPGQSTQEVMSGGLLQWIKDLEPGLTTAGSPTNFQMADYILFKAAGMMVARRDPLISEWVIQSGVTSVDPTVFPQLAPVKRRRMADFIQDSCATICLTSDKLPRTEDRVDSLLGALEIFLEGLLSRENPVRRRIADFSIDPVSGNTSDLQGAGIFVIIIKVQLLDTMDFIVLQTQVGETVRVTAIDNVRQ